MFKLIRIENGRENVPSPVFHEAAAEAISVGEALVLNTSGKLTKCGATVKPAYIAMGQVSASAADRRVAVCRVESNQVYEVPVSAKPTSLVPGAKVTLYTDGLQVTATTTDGVATIESVNGATEIGDTIIVRF